jgi:hypothetical protein
LWRMPRRICGIEEKERPGRGKQSVCDMYGGIFLCFSGLNFFNFLIFFPVVLCRGGVAGGRS